MKRIALLALFLLLLPWRAEAAFPIASSSVSIDGTQTTVYESTWTTTLGDVAQDTSACTRLEYLFDPSIDDASTDATFSLHYCLTGTYDAATCGQLATITNVASETNWQSASHARAYTILRKLTATVGGDTARFKLRCTAPTTTDGAADSVASQPYDREVDLTAGTLSDGSTSTPYTNPFQAMQVAINPWIVNTTNGNTFRVNLKGNIGTQQTPGYTALSQCPPAPGGDYRRCVMVAPNSADAFVTSDGTTAATSATGWPIGDSVSPSATASLLLNFDDVVIYPRNDSGVTQPQVLFQIGNGYGYGFDASASAGLTYASNRELGGVAATGYNRVKLSGDVFIFPGNTNQSGTNAYEDGILGGRPNGLPFNQNMPSTALIGFFFTGADYVDASDLRIHCLLDTSSGTGGDDVCVFMQHSIDVQLGEIDGYGGTGLIQEGQVQGSLGTFASSFGKTGIQVGDPYVGAGNASSWFCTAGFKAAFAATDPDFQASDVGQVVTWTSGESGKIVSVRPGVVVTGAAFVAGDAGKAISWSGGGSGTGTINSVVSGTDMNYNITTGTEMTTGAVVTCASCNTPLAGAATTSYGSSDITYRITATDETSLSGAKIGAGDTITCAGCAGGTVAKVWSSDTSANCGVRGGGGGGNEGLWIQNVHSIEGNSWGNLNIYSAYKFGIDQLWSEQNGTSSTLDYAPSILIGAGACTSDQYQPCWHDSACGTGTCQYPAARSDPWQNATFGDGSSGSALTAAVWGPIALATNQGQMGAKIFTAAADTTLAFAGGTTTFRRSQVAPGIAVGAGFQPSFPQYGRVQFGGFITPSDADTTLNDATACSDEVGGSPTIACRPFLANTSATGVMDLTSTAWRNSTDVKPGVTTASTTTWYTNATYSGDSLQCVSAVPLAVSQADYPVVTEPHDSFVMSVSCRCASGTCTTPAQLSFEDQGATAFTTGTVTCNGATGTATWVPVTAGNTISAGETLRFDVTNAQSASGNYVVCARVLDGW